MCATFSSGYPYKTLKPKNVTGRSLSPAENPECFEGKLVQFHNVTKLPGQILLMGNEALGWSLITAGPCAGEVWTVGSFGVRRAPACTFAQWLELILDQNMEAYLTYCLTGEGGRRGRARHLPELIGSEFTWPQGVVPTEKCACWLEDNRFVYEGPSPIGRIPQRADSPYSRSAAPGERREAFCSAFRSKGSWLALECQTSCEVEQGGRTSPTNLSGRTQCKGNWSIPRGRMGTPADSWGEGTIPNSGRSDLWETL